MTIVPTLPPTPASRPRRTGLKGLLAVIFWCACGITATQLAWPFTLIATIGPSATVSAVVDALSGPSVQTQILRYGVIPQVALFVWAASYVVLTVTRSAKALTFAPILMALWVGISIYCQFGIRAVLTPDGLSVETLPALLPSMLAQVVGAVAFWAYFKQADAPRAFFTR
ncbi:MAG: hypothetical protein B7Y84_09815 [Azorhizobium sp. 32-67-21]|nr:MAG: hypothetical protein B7Z30_03670 [Rhizobiales bacterium 12-68-15]OYX88015.1 MAG: hypothetical protein B7Y84_09815 [Azorhizobium sp. 32-67-21]